MVVCLWEKGGRKGADETYTRSFYSWRRYCNKHKKRLGGYKMSHCLSPSPEEDDEEEEEGEGENEGEGGVGGG